MIRSWSVGDSMSSNNGGRALRYATVLFSIVLLGSSLACCAPPPSSSRVERGRPPPDPKFPMDEALAGRTSRGTPIAKRSPDCFPAETRNLFSDVDMVPDGSGGLAPFVYPSTNNGITADGRKAIRGQNTWIAWAGGNEAFWGWTQEEGYGLLDFLVLLDSRQRGHRFHDSGLINQPGMRASTSRDALGLYLDVADGDKVWLDQPKTDVDAATGKPATQIRPPPDLAHKQPLFEFGDDALNRSYDQVLKSLARDGLDPTIYGYPSGVVGLRLFANPDFFGKTTAAAAARKHWNARVVQASGDPFYRKETGVQADPMLVRPFRVGMSCGFCHVGPHPLNPPKDPEKPEWANLSSTIGNQYWRPEKIFSNLKGRNSLLFQLLASQQPGTIDTSLISTDNINNSNTINAIFDVPARLDRARTNTPEDQSEANLIFPGIEDSYPGANPRHTPRVLIDGADSIGVYGALARVYLNIGTFSEEWRQLHNTIVGFRPQQPFSAKVLESNSNYWIANNYRVGFLAKFFTVKSSKTGKSITAPMKLADVASRKDDLDGKDLARYVLTRDTSKAVVGRAVFLRNCAVCHSSKQLGGFTVTFSDAWRKSSNQVSSDGSAHLVMPMTFADWEAFKQSKAYKTYSEAIKSKADKERDAFFEDNFLSTEIRIPITLVGTNSARSVATNGMRGQIWDNFSSESYKRLPAVGAIHFYNPYSGKPVDSWGNNDTYMPPAGGPGYYRPASLISLWATAPYFHNNALGIFNNDPSIAGRLKAFDDGIDKLLWKAKRGPSGHMGDLRASDPDLTQGDPGFIYRITETSELDFPKAFIRPLLVGVLGPVKTELLTTYVWLVLAVLFAILAVWGLSRHAGFTLGVFTALTGAAIALTRLDTIWWWLWLAPLITAAGAVWFSVKARPHSTRALFAVLALSSVAAAVAINAFVDGELGDLRVGPIPKGTPVNLIMNLDPDKPTTDMSQAAFAMLRAILRIRTSGATGAQALAIFQKEAGPALIRASKSPDFVLDRGHWFAESLSDEDKESLKAFLRTL
jgi:hypothetical protein